MASRFARMMGVFLSAAPLLAAAGCTSEPDRPTVERAPSTEPRRLAPGPYQPIAFPSPPGSEIDHDRTVVVGSAEQWYGTMVLSTGMSPADVNAFYARALPERGWSALSSLISSNRVVLQFVNHGRGSAAIVMIDPGGMLYPTHVEVVVAPLVGTAEETRRSR